MNGKGLGNQGVSSTNRVFSTGILLLSVSLVIANIYLFTRTKNSEKDEKFLVETGTEVEVEKIEEGLKWEQYINEAYGYSVSYPPLLEPRTIESENFLSFIIFFVPTGIAEPGFGISVRENSLEDEVGLIKKEITSGVDAQLVKEEKILKDDMSGVKLEYVPLNPEDGETREFYIVNNGRYSYTISSTPELIDKIFSDFKVRN